LTQQKKIHLIDTNIIIRYLMGDDINKANLAAELMLKVENGLENIEISSVVTAEIIWTLEKFYKVPKLEISNKLLTIFSFRGIKGFEKGIIIEALRLYASHNIDFVDCYLAAKSVEKAMPIYTFDKKDFTKLKADWETP